MPIKKNLVLLCLTLIFVPFTLAHHAMEFIEMESYNTAFKGDFVFHLHYDYMVDDQDNPKLDHWEYTPGLSYGITSRLMLDVHAHLSKFGVDHVLPEFHSDYEPDGPSPFMEAMAFSLQYRLTRSFPIDIGIVGSCEFPFQQSKDILGGEEMVSGTLIFSKTSEKHSTVCLNLTAGQDGSDHFESWALGGKMAISDDPHGIAAGIEILGDFDGTQTILPGIYIPLGSENMSLKTGIEWEPSGDSLRANITFLFRF